jgi:hypothetical protein
VIEFRTEVLGRVGAPHEHSNNGRAVAAYENYARRYAAAVSPPSGSGVKALRSLADVPPSSPQILEIGSEPGRDADFLAQQIVPGSISTPL